jgi:hypothetical protein
MAARRMTKLSADIYNYAPSFFAHRPRCLACCFRSLGSVAGNANCGTKCFNGRFDVTIVFAKQGGA